MPPNLTFQPSLLHWNRVCVRWETSSTEPPSLLRLRAPHYRPEHISLYSVSIQYLDNAFNALGVAYCLPSLCRRWIIYVWWWIYVCFCPFFFFLLKFKMVYTQGASCSLSRSLPSCKTLLACGWWWCLLVLFRFKTDFFRLSCAFQKSPAHSRLETSKGWAEKSSPGFFFSFFFFLITFFSLLFIFFLVMVT